MLLFGNQEGNALPPPSVPSTPYTLLLTPSPLTRRYRLKRFLARKNTFAGRSASRLMYHGYQDSP